MRIKTFLLIGIILWWGPSAYGDIQGKALEVGHGPTKSFVYVAKKFGVPVLRASIRIVKGSPEQGRYFNQIQAQVDSLQYIGLLFRMNNRFTSTMEVETCIPVRYVKEIDQEGFLVPKKHYLQTLTFDYRNKRVLVEDERRREKQEVPLPSDTYDPLSMFARCYLKEELHPDRDIRMSIYDGVKLHQLVFHLRRERVKSKMYGEVEAFRLESNTSFSSFDDKEGAIRIWYTADGKKTPISLEVDLPVGSLKFELEEIEEG